MPYACLETCCAASITRQLTTIDVFSRSYYRANLAIGFREIPDYGYRKSVTHRACPRDAAPAHILVLAPLHVGGRKAEWKKGESASYRSGIGLTENTGPRVVEHDDPGEAS